MTVRTASAERLAPAGMILGEGPIALGDGFACVDIRPGEVWRGSLDGRLDIVARYPGAVSSVAELDDGRLVATTKDSVCLVDDDLSIRIDDLDDDVRFNDAKPDPAGRFVVGTMGDPVRPGSGSLWSVSSGRSTRLLDDLTISNGLCWSADGSTMFHIDTPTQRIDAFDYDLDRGALSGRRTVVEIPADVGAPDGMTIDTDGGLWVALWGGSAVHRYVDGALDAIVAVPTPYVTCPAFVGSDLDIMVITTASEPDGRTGGAGDVYVADTGCRGRPSPKPSVASIFG